MGMCDKAEEELQTGFEVSDGRSQILAADTLDMIGWMTILPSEPDYIIKIFLLVLGLSFSLTCSPW